MRNRSQRLSNDRILHRATMQGNNNHHGEGRRTRQEKEKEILHRLRSLFPHASSCRSFSTCRRSHFVRSSRVLLIACLFSRQQPSYPSGHPHLAMCHFFFLTDNRWFRILLPQSLIFLRSTLCCSFESNAATGRRIEFGA